MQRAVELLAKVWFLLRGNLQWRILYWLNPKFIVGVCGICLNEENQVLLLQHRFWARGSWGLPSGYAHRQETFEQAIMREVAEETGLALREVQLQKVVSGYRLRMELYFLARIAGESTITIDRREVLNGQFFHIENLPDSLLDAHRRVLVGTDWGRRHE